MPDPAAPRPSHPLAGAGPDPLARTAAATCAIIPALDEGETLPGILAGLRALGIGAVRVVDNGSRDRTASVARAGGAEVLVEPRRGYGAACWRGMRDLPASVEWVLFCDADGSDDPADIRTFLDAAARGADFVLGDRRALPSSRAALTPVQHFGNGLATALIRAGWGRRFRDLGPLRMLRRTALERLGMRDRGFGWTVEMQIRAVEERLRIRELPVRYRPRAGGRSKISGTITGSARAGAVILSTVARLWLRRALRRHSNPPPVTPTICLMLKAPRPGTVKTRLALALGDPAAAEVYRLLAERQVREVPAGWSMEIHFAPAEAGDEMRRWLGPLAGPDTRFVAQAEGDLGARLRAATISAFGRGASKLLFVGGDCPQLNGERLGAAAAALDHRDTVMIPARDGGYVLIGMADPHPELFDGIRWSTASVRDDTLSRIADAGLECALLEPLEDVDDIESLRRTAPDLTAAALPRFDNR